MWMVGGPVELRQMMSLHSTALSMRSLKNGKPIRRAEMWTHIVGRLGSHNVGILGGQCVSQDVKNADLQKGIWQITKEATETSCPKNGHGVAEEIP